VIKLRNYGSEFFLISLSLSPFIFVQYNRKSANGKRKWQKMACGAICSQMAKNGKV
jgi:hypothetical protein